MDTRTTDPDPLLYLLQVTSAAFPSGAFSHSGGFETLVASGEVDDAQSLEAAVLLWLELGLAPADGGAVALAHRAALAGDASRLAAIDATVGALKAPREAYEASVNTGSATLRVIEDAFGGAGIESYRRAVRSGECEGHACTVFGVCAAAHGIDRREAVLAYLHATVANVVGVVGRLVPLGQFDVQRVLGGTRGAIGRCTQEALERDLEELAGMTAFLDVASMAHERLTTRLCIS